MNKSSLWVVLINSSGDLGLCVLSTGKSTGVGFVYGVGHTRGFFPDWRKRAHVMLKYLSIYRCAPWDGKLGLMASITPRGSSGKYNAPIIHLYRKQLDYGNYVCATLKMKYQYVTRRKVIFILLAIKKVEIWEWQ